MTASRVKEAYAQPSKSVLKAVRDLKLSFIQRLLLMEELAQDYWPL